MAKKKTKRYKGPAFSRFLRFALILFIALIIVYSYYLSTKGILLQQIKASSLSIYQYVGNLVKKNPIVLAGLASYIVVFYLGYWVGKKR